MNCNRPGLPVHHQLPEFTQTRVRQVSDAIQPSHPLLSPSLPALNPSQHQGLFKWVSSSHQVAKILEFQLQHQSFQWTIRSDFLSLLYAPICIPIAPCTYPLMVATLPLSLLFIKLALFFFSISLNRLLALWEQEHHWSYSLCYL